jgi:hypothetical protein
MWNDNDRFAAGEDISCKNRGGGENNKSQNKNAPLKVKRLWGATCIYLTTNIIPQLWYNISK